MSPPPYRVDRRILEREVVVDTFRASGPGGQHRNTTNSAVRLRHVPSGVTVVAADSRSQHRNRETAFLRLVRRLEILNRVPRRRVPTAIPRRTKERRLADKKHQGSAKDQRGRISEGD